MDHIYRRPELQRVLRVLNQKEDRDLQRKLIMLDKQHRYTQKMLQQRRDKLINEARRMVMVQVCEPKATVSIAMKEIAEYERNAGRYTHLLDDCVLANPAMKDLNSWNRVDPYQHHHHRLNLQALWDTKGKSRATCHLCRWNRLQRLTQYQKKSWPGNSRKPKRKWKGWDCFREKCYTRRWWNL